MAQDNRDDDGISWGGALKVTGLVTASVVGASVFGGDIAEAIRDYVQPALEATTSAAADGSEWFGKGASDGINSLATSMGVTAGDTSTIDGMIERLGGMVDKTSGEAGKALDAVSKSLTDFSNEVGATYTTEKAAMDAWWTQNQPAIESAYNSTKDSVISAVDTTTDAVSNMSPAGKIATGAAVGGVGLYTAAELARRSSHNEYQDASLA